MGSLGGDGGRFGLGLVAGFRKRTMVMKEKIKKQRREKKVGKFWKRESRDISLNMINSLPLFGIADRSKSEYTCVGIRVCIYMKS